MLVRRVSLFLLLTLIQQSNDGIKSKYDSLPHNNHLIIIPQNENVLLATVELSASVVDIGTLTLSDYKDNKDDFSGFQDN